MDSFCGNCSNCGKSGHGYQLCKMPIISMGVIAFMIDDNGEYRFLMICRKDTLGFMDFMRGKYSIYNKEYIINLLKEMTINEKEQLLTYDFDSLWKKLWCNSSISMQYKIEESTSKEKFNALVAGIMTQNDTYTLADLIAESNTYDVWEEAEWGFPKGRRNHNEKDMDCAVREFVEETGYSAESLYNIENLQYFEEIFMGSNYKSYKHKYYLMKMNELIQNKKSYDKREVSKVEWKTFDECLKCIRPYNLEKKKLIEDVNRCLTMYKLTG
jgi:ADP-ribose pyrophosphatase YjhB (NUDIX family)